MKIFLDDIRFPPAPGWSICRNLDDFYFTWGKNREYVTDIAFDHDLGSKIESGFDALALVEHDILTGLPVRPDLTMTVHSMNFEEARKMREVIKRLEEKIHV
jgi:hypothetical protein